MNLCNKIKVSVIILTYNHENYIKKAIESVLSQKTNFEFELIIIDDFSSDSTEKIIKQTLLNYSHYDNITYNHNNKNEGVMKSWIKAHNKIKGEYFAICEGDDYWTDEFKLQKQVDFLEQHKEFAICFHNVQVNYIDIPFPNFELNSNLKTDIFTINDLIGETEIWFMATASLMIRMSSIKTIPEWIIKSKSGDIPLIILASKKGKIKYLPDLMAVYQKHSKGMSMTDYKDDAIFLRNRIFMYKMLNFETNYFYKNKLRLNIAGYYYLMLDSKQFRDKYFHKLIISLKYLFYSFPNTSHYKDILKNHILPFWLIKSSRFIKQKIGLIPS